MIQSLRVLNMAEAIDPILWFRRASPYIYLHRQKTFVLCLDDQAMSSDNVSNVLRDITLLHSLGVRIILVHGSCALEHAAPRIQRQSIPKETISKLGSQKSAGRRINSSLSCPQMLTTAPLFTLI